MKGNKLLRSIAFTLLIASLTLPVFSQVVISQIYGGGGNSGSYYKNDYMEIFNRGQTAVNINGWSVQYASASGSTWQVTELPDFTLQPGQYFLIQQGAGSGGTADLPDPDVIGMINMSSTNGKVALSNTLEALTGTNPSGAAVMDLVGFGTANGYEGAAAPAPSNTTAIFRSDFGCTDTDNNSADFAAGSPEPRNSGSDLNVCSDEPKVATPVFSPPGGYFYVPVMVNISTDTEGAMIYYTDDGSVPDQNSTLFTEPFSLNSTTTIKAIGIKDGMENSFIASATFNFPDAEWVADITDLRSGTVGNTYLLAGEGILTYQRSSRNQKYLQDSGSAILIDDPEGKITTKYEIGDGINSILGVLNEYRGMLQFVPLADPGEASSSLNPVIPEVRTLNSITSDDQAKLLQIEGVNFTSAGSVFETGKNYELTSESGNGIFRTSFFEADYIGEEIPAGQLTINVLVGQFEQDIQLTSRFKTDINTSGNSYENNELSYFRVWPNPFSSYIKIDDLIKDGNLRLINSKGQEVRNIKVGTDNLHILTDDIAPGLYIIQFNGTDGIYRNVKILKN